MLYRAFLKHYGRRTYWVAMVSIYGIGFILLWSMSGIAAEQYRLNQSSPGMLTGEDWLMQGMGRIELAPVVIILALLGVQLFIDDRQPESGDLMYSLPISRGSIFLTKWLTGVMVIGVSYILLMLRFRQLYTSYGHLTSTPFGVVIQFVMALTLTSILLLTILLLVHTQFGQALVAGGIGSLLILGYSLATTLVSNLIWYNTGLPYDHPFITWLMRVKHFRLNDLFMPDLLSNEHGQLMYVYQRWGAMVIVLALGIGLTYWLGHLAYTQGRAERRGELFIFPALRPIFLWVTALGIGLAMAYWTTSPGLGHNILRLDLLFLVGTIWSYFLLNKALRAVGRGA